MYKELSRVQDARQSSKANNKQNKTGSRESSIFTLRNHHNVVKMYWQKLNKVLTVGNDEKNINYILT